MTETHIHIHLSGLDQAPETKKTQSKPVEAPSATQEPPKKKRKPSAYSKRYSRALKKVSKKHMTKKGTWKKGGFKRAVKEAHKLARK